MGTSYHVTVIDPPGGTSAAQYQSDIDVVLARIDASMPRAGVTPTPSTRAPLMVLGPEQGLALAEREGLAVYMLLRVPDGFEARQSAAFARYASPDGD
jgi:hypothetical protein